MSLKFSRMFCKFAGVVFTSIIVPISLKQLDDVGHEGPAVESIATTAPLVVPKTPPPATTRIVVQGSGATPEAAFQNAIDTAVKQAVASEVSAVEWNRHGQAYLALVRQDGSGILRGWREMSSMSERRFAGRIYRSEVAVDVDEQALRSRFQTSHNIIHP